MIDSLFSGVRRIKTPLQFTQAQELAKANQHDFILPTHVVVKGGKVVGHASVGAITYTHVNFSPEMVAEDSFQAIHIIENLVEEGGGRVIITPIGKDSPFHSTMTNPKMGYKFLANVDLFMKEIQ